MKRLLFLFLAWTFCASAYAQIGIEVNVLDIKKSKVLPGIEVTLKNDQIGYQQTKTTNSQGKVFFPGLSTSGAYVVSVVDDGYYPIVTDPLVLKSNSSRSVTLGLTEKTTVELDEITVQASNSIARINTLDSEVSAELNLEQVEALPVRGRDVEQALFRLPNVVKATGSFEGVPDVSVNGGDPLFTNYLIDGLDNNENFLGGPKFPIPTGFAQNITVLSNNYSAEFGQSIDGVFNITTKSGSNNYDGEAFFVTRPGPVIDANSGFLQDNDAQAGFQRYQGGFGVGGPIIKDKTFFYLNAEGTINLNDNVLRVPQLGFSETVRGEDKLGLFSGKIDHNWNDRFRSSLRANVGLVDFERQGGGLSGGGIVFPSASYIEDRDSYVIANKNTYVGSNFTSETSLQYSRFYWNFSRPVNDTNSPDVTLVDPSGIAFARLGAPGFPFIEYENTGQLKQKFNFTRGNHQIKTGGGVIISDFSLSGGGNPFGSYLVQLSQPQIDQLAQQNFGTDLTINDVPSNAQVLNYQVNLRSETFGDVQKRYNVYVEDLWSVSDKLKLTFGLRYDYDNLSKGGNDQGDLNNFGPRFSFNYRLNEKSILRGGYGRFYQKIVYSIISDALEFNRNSADFRTQLQALIDAGRLPADTNIDAITFDGPLQASVANVNYLQGPGREQLQGQRNGIFSNNVRINNPEGYDNPYSNQFVIGYQRQLRDDLLFSVDLFYNASRDEFRLREVNAPSSVRVTENFPNGQVRSPRDADATRSVPILYDNNGNPFALVNGDSLFGASRTVSTVESKGQSDYYAATLNLTKDRGGDNYSYQLFYTLSRLRTNTEGFNFRAVDANRFEDEFGPSVNDRTHVLEGFFTYYPYDGLAITTTAQIQSGQPVNRVPDAANYFYIDQNGNQVNTTDLNGNGNGRAFEGTNFNPIADRAPGESRNGDRLPWAPTFDVSLKYKLPLGGDQRLQFRADIFNLFNADNLSGFINDGSPTNQLQVGPASSGRFVQRASSPPRQFQFSLSYLF